ncbi:MAG: glycosyl transferase family A [Rhizobiales bacterium]|nr:glycosyl transferase family A [Hyphomicrobiales bacterium]MBA70207.1 glycosyl transferase family A [Hyphomicrobiales bacterium]|tara:strand:+ start:342 stop:1337 length:996 start_codon:yes stop_codon:yes gene_type:complete
MTDVTTTADNSIAFRSAGLAPESVERVVTLPTFRRPDHLVETLDSLARQRHDSPFAIIVMENDADGRAGAQAARAWFETAPVEGLVVIAAQRGNCHAYNAGWEAALSEFPKLREIAVIDDDEIADPEWLERLSSAATATGADFVGGPQVPVFDGPDLEGWAQHPAFTPPYSETGIVPILFSSGNVLIQRRVLDRMPRPFLDPAFNFIGGGDSDFYRRSRKAGFTFAWCHEARVMETVPARRTEFSWLNARSLRNGALSAIIERRENPGLGARIKILAKSLALLLASPIRGLQLFAETGSPVIGLYHAQVALGRLLSEFGRVNEQYRNPEAN